MKKKIVGDDPQPPQVRNPPCGGGVDDNVHSSAMEDSWLARMDGEKITPRLVGEAGVDDDDGDGAVPSGKGRT